MRPEARSPVPSLLDCREQRGNPGAPGSFSWSRVAWTAPVWPEARWRKLLLSTLLHFTNEGRYPWGDSVSLTLCVLDRRVAGTEELLHGIVESVFPGILSPGGKAVASLKMTGPITYGSALQTLLLVFD